MATRDLITAFNQSAKNCCARRKKDIVLLALCYFLSFEFLSSHPAPGALDQAAITISEDSLRSRERIIKTIGSNDFLSLLEFGYSFSDDVSDDFKDQINASLAPLNYEFRTLLKESGVKLKAGRLSDMTKPSVFTNELSPDDGDPRTHINQASGSYFWKDNLVTVSQEYEHMNYIRSIKEPTHEKYYTENSSIIDVSHHELGHAISKNLGELLVGKHLSTTSAFARAYKLDLDVMGGYEAAHKNGYGYFVRAGKPKVGAEELMADLFSNIIDGAKNKKEKRSLEFDWRYSSMLASEMSGHYVSAVDQGTLGLRTYFEGEGKKLEAVASFLSLVQDLRKPKNIQSQQQFVECGKFVVANSMEAYPRLTAAVLRHLAYRERSLGVKPSMVGVADQIIIDYFCDDALSAKADKKIGFMLMHHILSDRPHASDETRIKALDYYLGYIDRAKPEAASVLYHDLLYINQRAYMADVTGIYKISDAYRQKLIDGTVKHLLRYYAASPTGLRDEIQNTAFPALLIDTEKGRMVMDIISSPSRDAGANPNKGFKPKAYLHKL